MDDNGIKNLVSVIVPLFNAETTIVNCLNSIFEQTYHSLEIIIVNDGSTDKSLEIVTEIANQHPLQKIVIANQKNGGVSTARNTGIKLSQGEFIAFLDADDFWLPNKIEKQITVLDNNEEIGMIGCNSIDDKIIFSKLKEENGLVTVPYKTFVYKNYFQPSTVVIRKSVINQIGLFEESQKYAEEGNYFLRVAHKYKCVLMNERLIDYGVGVAGFINTGLSSNLWEMEKGELRNLKFAYANKIINGFEYTGYIIFSILKFIRRKIIAKFKQTKNSSIKC